MAGNTIKMKDLPSSESSRVTDLIGLDTQGQSVKLPNEQNEIKTEVANLGSKVGELPSVIKTEEDGDLFVIDKNGNVLAKYVDGHIVTKNFDSRYIPLTKIEEDDLCIADTGGRILVRFSNGHIQTKNFDSSKGSGLDLINIY